MKTKMKALALTTAGAFALSYVVVGANAFADMSATPVAPSTQSAPVPSVTTPTFSPIQPPAGFTSPSTGISQGDDDDMDEQSEEVNRSGDDDEGTVLDDDFDDQISASESGDDLDRSGNSQIGSDEDD
jgi:hypothetical protein